MAFLGHDLIRSGEVAGKSCLKLIDSKGSFHMHVTVVGTGYVGLVSGAGFADFGLNVTCVDRDEQKIRMLNEGNIPIYEIGLEEIIRQNVKNGRLSFSTDLREAVRRSLVVFIAVGTPEGTN